MLAGVEIERETVKWDSGKVKRKKTGMRKKKQMTSAWKQYFHKKIGHITQYTPKWNTCTSVCFCAFQIFANEDNYEIIGILCISSIITGLNFYFDPFRTQTQIFSMLLLYSMLCVCALARVHLLQNSQKKCRLQRFLMLFLIWYNSKLWSQMNFLHAVAR